MLYDKWCFIVIVMLFWVGSVVNNKVYYLENMQCNLNNNLLFVLIINLLFDFLNNLIFILK